MLDRHCHSPDGEHQEPRNVICVWCDGVMDAPPVPRGAPAPAREREALLDLLMECWMTWSRPLSYKPTMRHDGGISTLYAVAATLERAKRLEREPGSKYWQVPEPRAASTGEQTP